MGEIKVSINCHSKSAYKSEVISDEFNFIVDGSQEEGPSPVAYLIGALGGCLNMVSHIVADEMDIEIQELKIDIDGTLNPSVFLGSEKEGRPGFHGLNVSFNVKSNADSKKLDEWIGLVRERCPLYDNISNATPIMIELNQ